jgi:hypothetical protein
MARILSTISCAYRAGPQPRWLAPFGCQPTAQVRPKPSRPAQRSGRGISGRAPRPAGPAAGHQNGPTRAMTRRASSRSTWAASSSPTKGSWASLSAPPGFSGGSSGAQGNRLSQHQRAYQGDSWSGSRASTRSLAVLQKGEVRTWWVAIQLIGSTGPGRSRAASMARARPSGVRKLLAVNLSPPPRRACPTITVPS